VRAMLRRRHPTARRADTVIGGDICIWNPCRAKSVTSTRRSSLAPLQFCPCYSAGTASRVSAV
jgi:hypothetical protein